MEENATPITDTPSAITPAGAANVSFNDQLTQVQTAITDRQTAKDTVDSTFKAVVDTLRKYDWTTSLMPFAAETALRNEAKALRVKVQIPDVAQEVKDLADLGYWVSVDGTQTLAAIDILDRKFSGFRDFISSLDTYYRAKQGKVDEEATKTAQADVNAVIDTYVAAVNEYNKANQKLADVEQYIGVVEKIANISAAAQGKAEK